MRIILGIIILVFCVWFFIMMFNIPIMLYKTYKVRKEVEYVKWREVLEETKEKKGNE